MGRSNKKVASNLRKAKRSFTPKVVKKATEQYEERAKKALVLQYINHHIGFGDVLVRAHGSDFYVKEGEELKFVHKTKRYGFLWLKSVDLSAPNHFSVAHVEGLPEYFKVSLKEYPTNPKGDE